MDEIVTKVGKAGRLVIPAAHRRALGLRSGDKVLVRLDDQGLHVITARQAVARAQAALRRYVPEGEPLVDELIEERRREAKGD